MKLFLSGGGGKSQSVELDEKFASIIDKEKPLLYIPIAIDTKIYPYPNCYRYITGTFNPLGIKKIEMWTEDEIRTKPAKELDKFGGVFIGGGNTFYLLKEFQKSGFLQKIAKLLKNDIPIYGGSAGAIIFGKSILTTHDLNFVGLKDFDGLNLVDDSDIWCHYEPSENGLVAHYIKEHKSKVIALPEDCGLYLTDNSMEVVGPGSAFVFDKNKKEVKPGNKV